MYEDRPTVNVLLSTYNGRRFLREQLDSVLAQEKVEVHITVRDDGSTDGTGQLLRQYKTRYPKKITLLLEENTGYRNSFFRLLKVAEEADYYAFCDQDDVWEKDKLSQCIKELYTKEDAHLCVCGFYVTDEKLRIMDRRDWVRHKSDLKSIFVRNRFPGCAMLFDRKIKELAGNLVFSDRYLFPSHDLIVSAVSYLCGNVVFYNEPVLWHRRSAGSVTVRNGSPMSRIKTEWDYLFHKHNECANLAYALLCGDTEDIKRRDKAFLKKVARNKRDVRARKKLIFDKDFSCGILLCDIESRCKICLGSY